MNTTETESLEPGTIDFSKRYKVDGYPGIAFRVLRYAEYPSRSLDWICRVSGHAHDADCYIEEFFEAIDYDFVVAVVVGSDCEYLIDVRSLTPIDGDEYCSSCSQMGCDW